MRREFESALSAYHAARHGTAEGIGGSGLLKLIADEANAVAFRQQAIQILTGQLDGLPSRRDVACGAGCFFCCHQRIDVTPMEAVAIAGYLRATCPSDQLTQLNESLVAVAERVLRLSKKEYARARIRCGLLDADGKCTVYPVRPTACVGWHSMSRDRCQEIYEKGDPGTEGVPSDMVALLQSRGFADGMADATRAAARQADSHELHSAVLRALDAPDAVQRWAAGEDPFGECTPAVLASDAIFQFRGKDGRTLGLKWEGPSADGAAFRLVVIE